MPIAGGQQRDGPRPLVPVALRCLLQSRTCPQRGGSASSSHRPHQPPMPVAGVANVRPRTSFGSVGEKTARPRCTCTAAGATRNPVVHDTSGRLHPSTVHLHGENASASIRTHAGGARPTAGRPRATPKAGDPTAADPSRRDRLRRATALSVPAAAPVVNRKASWPAVFAPHDAGSCGDGRGAAGRRHGALKATSLRRPLDPMQHPDWLVQTLRLARSGPDCWAPGSGAGCPPAAEVAEATLANARFVSRSRENRPKKDFRNPTLGCAGRFGARPHTGGH